jgi:hypothetical protein
MISTEGGSKDRPAGKLEFSKSKAVGFLNAVIDGADEKQLSSMIANLVSAGNVVSKGHWDRAVAETLKNAFVPFGEPTTIPGTGGELSGISEPEEQKVQKRNSAQELLDAMSANQAIKIGSPVSSEAIFAPTNDEADALYQQMWGYASGNTDERPPLKDPNWPA